MAKQKWDRKRIIILTAAIVLVAAIGIAILVKALNSGKDDPYQTQETSQSDASKSDSDASSDTPKDTPEESTPETPAIDPASVSTVDIEPMEITVSYVKGINGFEFEVLRTPGGTKYVEFRSENLIGTKCTNDKGTFASILADPEGNESTGLAKTTTVDGVTYGLSLADQTCTSDATGLQEYQKSFSDAFSLLKKMN